MKVVFCGSDNIASFEALKILLQLSLKVECCLLSNEKNAELIPFCEQNGIQLVYSVEELKVDEIDLLISFSYKRLLPLSVVNKAKLAINFHPAPLPFYRGRGTTSQVLIQNGDKWGVTCHFIGEKFDTGRIIERRWFNITDELRTGKRLSEYSWQLCVELLKEVVSNIIENKPINSFEQEKDGHYYSMKELQDAKVVNVYDAPESVNRKIEALWFPPYEGAYIEIGGEKFFLLNENLLKEVSSFYK